MLSLAGSKGILWSCCDADSSERTKQMFRESREARQQEVQHAVRGPAHAPSGRTAHLQESAPVKPQQAEHRPDVKKKGKESSVQAEFR